jgi:hypothetical protein
LATFQAVDHFDNPWRQLKDFEVTVVVECSLTIIGFRVVTHARPSFLQHQSFFAGDHVIPDWQSKGCAVDVTNSCVVLVVVVAVLRMDLVVVMVAVTVVVAVIVAVVVCVVVNVVVAVVVTVVVNVEVCVVVLVVVWVFVIVWHPTPSCLQHHVSLIFDHF